MNDFLFMALSFSLLVTIYVNIGQSARLEKLEKGLETTCVRLSGKMVDGLCDLSVDKGKLL